MGKKGEYFSIEATGKLPCGFFISPYRLPQGTVRMGKNVIIHVLFERRGWEQWGRNLNGFCFLNIPI
jgi:hypothetical protein